MKGDRCIQRTGKVDINFSEINKNRSQDKDQASPIAQSSTGDKVAV